MTDTKLDGSTILRSLRSNSDTRILYVPVSVRSELRYILPDGRRDAGGTGRQINPAGADARPRTLALKKTQGWGNDISFGIALNATMPPEGGIEV
jgi:hypothetical protein